MGKLKKGMRNSQKEVRMSVLNSAQRRSHEGITWQTPEEMRGESHGCLEHILKTEVVMRAKVLETGHLCGIYQVPNKNKINFSCWMFQSMARLQAIVTVASISLPHSVI